MYSKIVNITAFSCALFILFIQEGKTAEEIGQSGEGRKRMTHNQQGIPERARRNAVPYIFDESTLNAFSNRLYDLTLDMSDSNGSRPLKKLRKRDSLTIPADAINHIEREAHLTAEGLSLPKKALFDQMEDFYDQNNRWPLLDELFDYVHKNNIPWEALLLAIDINRLRSITNDDQCSPILKKFVRAVRGPKTQSG